MQTNCGGGNGRRRGWVLSCLNSGKAGFRVGMMWLLQHGKTHDNRHLIEKRGRRLLNSRHNYRTLGLISCIHMAKFPPFRADQHLPVTNTQTSDLKSARDSRNVPTHLVPPQKALLSDFSEVWSHQKSRIHLPVMKYPISHNFPPMRHSTRHEQIPTDFRYHLEFIARRTILERTILECYG